MSSDDLEALRLWFCKLPRYSFHLSDSGGVVRVPDESGAWVDHHAVHCLFEGEVLDQAVAEMRMNKAIAKAKQEPTK